MDLLVLGANGLLGSNVVATARDRDRSVAGTVHKTQPALGVPLTRLDVTDHDRLRVVLDDHDPDAVVNCAAMTDVDACESNPGRAQAVNADAPGALAAACADRDIDLFHVSTDYVFDGTDGPYGESADPNPIQTYGESKLGGERQVRAADPNALVVRLSFVYGVHAATGALEGFPAWVRDRLTAGEPTPLFTDQHVTPTRAGEAAETILDLLPADANGTVHVAARSCVTPYDVGTAVRERLGADPSLIESGSMADVDRPADRPSNTCLEVDRVQRLLGRAQPTLAVDLDEIDHAL